MKCDFSKVGRRRPTKVLFFSQDFSPVAKPWVAVALLGYSPSSPPAEASWLPATVSFGEPPSADYPSPCLSLGLLVPARFQLHSVIDPEDV